MDAVLTGFPVARQSAALVVTVRASLPALLATLLNLAAELNPPGARPQFSDRPLSGTTRSSYLSSYFTIFPASSQRSSLSGRPLARQTAGSKRCVPFISEFGAESDVTIGGPEFHHLSGKAGRLFARTSI